MLAKPLRCRKGLLPSVVLSEAFAAVHLAELALQWKMMRALSSSASRRLAKICDYVGDPVIKCRFYVVIWALQKLPYVHSSLVLRALENLREINVYFDGMSKPNEKRELPGNPLGYSRNQI